MWLTKRPCIPIKMVMPKGLKKVWSSWNYRIQNDATGNAVTTTIYWMNSLQGVSKKKGLFHFHQ